MDEVKWISQGTQFPEDLLRRAQAKARMEGIYFRDAIREALKLWLEEKEPEITTGLSRQQRALVERYAGHLRAMREPEVVKGIEVMLKILDKLAGE